MVYNIVSMDLPHMGQSVVDGDYVDAFSVGIVDAKALMDEPVPS